MKKIGLSIFGLALIVLIAMNVNISVKSTNKAKLSLSVLNPCAWGESGSENSTESTGETGSENAGENSGGYGCDDNPWHCGTKETLTNTEYYSGTYRKNIETYSLSYKQDSFSESTTYYDGKKKLYFDMNGCQRRIELVADIRNCY